MIPIARIFYEFHRERIVSRPGQPVRTVVAIEIGPEIAREDAFRRVRDGKDVYTLMQEDAYRLASSLHPGRPVEESPHAPPTASPTGREDVYYRHFHPGGLHDRFGHIFFGERGENYPG